MVNVNVMDATTVAIIGGGPAGLTAALYLGRAKVNCIVFDRDLCGGQIIYSPLLENVPGFYGEGAALADQILNEVSKYPSVQFCNFTSVEDVRELDDNMYVLTLDDGTKLAAQYVICATGASPITLPRLEGENVHYCVTCDGPLYQDKMVAVVGGGNSALQYALELTKYARGVYVVTNEPTLRGEEEMRKRVLNHPLINVACNFPASEFTGGCLKSEYGLSIPVDGVFIAIGYRPNTSYLKDVCKIKGYFATDHEYRVSPYIDDNANYGRIFAVGDCRYKPFNQVVIAMGEGCQAALQIISDLEKQN